MAGAYITPLLELLEAMNARTEVLDEELARLQAERAKGREHMREVIANGEAMGALPDWMLEPLKKAAGMTEKVEG